MPSKQFEEKQIVEKFTEREKPGKPEKGEKHEKEYKESKEKEGKDCKDSEGKYEPDGKGQMLDKTHKDHGEIQDIYKTHKDHGEAHVAYPQFAAAASHGAPKLPEKYIVEKIPHKEKIEIKEFKHEKAEYEGIPGGTYPGGPVEQRLTALESAVSQLLHFIPENLRPDLTQGALKQEPDAAKPGAAGANKPADPKAEPSTKR